MPRITFDRVTKAFGDVDVLRDFSVTVADGEFLVLLGPSGCGKSTLLRMIAGLADVTSGTISFDDEVINDWDVRRREAAFVFQSYALYPQMTVRQNIAFPLLMDTFKNWHHLPIVSSVKRRQLLREPAIRSKIETIAEQLKLTSLLDRRPAKLSGGQRQRVALARSLVREPSLYLLDEPLSNLDAKLRTQMRTDITALHRAVGKTFIYVTHDQVEAMTMATTIIVLDNGLIQQVGTPDEIYDRPSNTFVATFVGSPPMNLIEGSAFVGGESLASDGVAPTAETLSSLIVGIRPEHLKLAAPGAGGLPASIEVIERVGAETLIGCRMTSGHEADDDALPSLVFVSAQAAVTHRIGDPCSLQANADSVSWFDKSTGQRLEATGADLEFATTAAAIESRMAIR